MNSSLPCEPESECAKLIRRLDRENISLLTFVIAWLTMLCLSAIYFIGFNEIFSCYEDRSSATVLAGFLFFIGWLLFVGDLWEPENTIHRLPVSAVHNAAELDVPIVFRCPWLEESY